MEGVNSLSSKRLSNEDENQENMNYNSPRFVLQKATMKHAPSQSQVFTDMKNFLSKCKDKTNVSAVQEEQKQILIQAIQQNNVLRKSINLTADTAHDPSNLQNFELQGNKRQSQQIQKACAGQQHKRSKSDANNLLGSK